MLFAAGCSRKHCTAGTASTSAAAGWAINLMVHAASAWRLLAERSSMQWLRECVRQAKWSHLVCQLIVLFDTHGGLTKYIHSMSCVKRWRMPDLHM